MIDETRLLASAIDQLYQLHLSNARGAIGAASRQDAAIVAGLSAAIKMTADIGATVLDVFNFSSGDFSSGDPKPLCAFAAFALGVGLALEYPDIGTFIGRQGVVHEIMRMGMMLGAAMEKEVHNHNDEHNVYPD